RLSRLGGVLPQSDQICLSSCDGSHPLDGGDGPAVAKARLQDLCREMHHRVGCLSLKNNVILAIPHLDPVLPGARDELETKGGLACEDCRPAVGIESFDPLAANSHSPRARARMVVLRDRSQPWEGRNGRERPHAARAGAEVAFPEGGAGLPIDLVAFTRHKRQGEARAWRELESGPGRQAVEETHRLPGTARLHALSLSRQLVHDGY